MRTTRLLYELVRLAAHENEKAAKKARIREGVLKFKIEIEDDLTSLIEIGDARATYDRYGDIGRIYLNVSHLELSLFKELSAVDVIQLQLKFDELMASWRKKYNAHIAKEEAQKAKQEALETLQNGNEIADGLIRDSEFKRHEIESILQHTLDVSDAVDWDRIKVHDRYIKKPFKVSEPSEPEYPKIGAWVEEPYVSPKVSLISQLFFQTKKIKERHLSDFNKGQARAKKTFETNKKKTTAQIQQMKLDYLDEVKIWKSKKNKWNEQQKVAKQEFEEEQELHNLKIDKLESQWRKGDSDAVVQHADLVLGASAYPDWFEPNYFIQFDEAQKLLMVEYGLPTPDVVNLIKSARFIRSTGEIKETPVSEAEKKRLFDHLCYQIALRSVHELFEADEARNLLSIAFNGVIDFVNAATGKQSRATILSAVFEKERFEELNLASVEPKACFKSFKGVAASSLIGLAPVNPVIAMDKEDSRFVESQDADLEDIESKNLASMDWEEFEHLVRAIFEEEFAVAGGEVKVTQASSDGGVDAIAFDPDPIRGGKIVIQAKRYTNTVGVAAVRELFGTVVNEGATKGILVTTADYGADAYKFASDKPPTLLNGGNLLYLLRKHGFKGRIDVKAARKEMGLG